MKATAKAAAALAILSVSVCSCLAMEANTRDDASASCENVHECASLFTETEKDSILEQAREEGFLPYAEVYPRLK